MALTNFVRSPNTWGCGAAVCAMATGSSYFDFVSFVGHDGSAYDEASTHPEKRRGFYFHEFVLFCLSQRFYLGLLIGFSESVKVPVDSTVINVPFCFKDSKALLIVENKISKIFPHAVYWDGENIFDPAYSEETPKNLQDYNILQIWPFQPISV